MDGYFATLSRRLETVSHSRLVNSIEQLAAEYVAEAAAVKQQYPTGPDEFFHVYHPPDKSTLTLNSLSTSRLPCGIQSCYAWDFQHADRRRAHTRNEQNILTGCRIRCCLIPNRPGRNIIDASVITLPAASPPEGASAPEEMEAEDEQPLGRHLPLSEQWIDGWRCSWRSKIPEEEEPSDVLRKLERKSERLKHLVPGQVETPRHRPPERLRLEATRQAERRRIREKGRVTA